MSTLLIIERTHLFLFIKIWYITHILYLILLKVMVHVYIIY